MLCIAYVLQFVHKQILQRLKASEDSFSFVSEVDSYPDVALGGKPEVNVFLLNPRSVPVSRRLARPVTHSCVLRGASAPHEMHDQRNDGHNEQQVNQAACNVECEKAHKPCHQ